MENVQTAEVQPTESPSGASVNEASQPSQTGEQNAGNPAETQVKTEAAEMISRLEYNKAREAERKARSELARLTKQLEGAKSGIELHQQLSQSNPEKIKQIFDLLQAKEEAKAEDESWMNDLDERVANKFREQKQLRTLVERELLSRINSLEQKLNSTETWTVGQNERALDNTFINFLEQNKIFPQVTEDVAQTPKFKMIQSYVLESLKEKCGDAKRASVEDLQEVLNEVKMGISEIGKQETIQKVQPVVPASGTKSGQIPKSDKVTKEDVKNLWSSFREGVGW